MDRSLRAERLPRRRAIIDEVDGLQCQRPVLPRRSVIAGFSAFQAVMLAVLAQPNLVIALANRAILEAIAPVFYLLAHRTKKTFRHARTITPNFFSEKRDQARSTPS